VPLIFSGRFSERMMTKPHKWVFTATPSGLDEASIGLQWFKAHWTDQRPPRVGMLHFDYTGAWEMLEGIKLNAERLGFEYVGNEVTSAIPPPIDTSTEWMRLAAKNPDIIYVLACGAALTTITKDAARLEIQKRGITLIHPYPCFDSNIRVVGEDAEGWYVHQYAPSILEEELPGMKALREAAEKYSGWEPENIRADYIVAWIQAQIVVEAIRSALEKVGFENLTGRAVRDAMASIEKFDTGLMPPITMHDNKPYFSDSEQIYEVRQRWARPTG